MDKVMLRLVSHDGQYTIRWSVYKMLRTSNGMQYGFATLARQFVTIINGH